MRRGEEEGGERSTDVGCSTGRSKSLAGVDDLFFALVALWQPAVAVFGL